MERKDLDEILKSLNNLMNFKEVDETLQPILDKICELTNSPKITVDEMQKYSVTNEGYTTELVKSWISAIEKKLKLEHKDYFYDNLDEYLISLANDDEKKLERLQTASEFDKLIIIKSMKDEGIKLEALSYLDDDKNKEIIIATFKDDDKRLRAINSIKEEKLKLEAIQKMKDDDKKIVAINKLTKDSLKVDAIKTLQNDYKKMQAIDMLTTEKAKIQVMLTIKEENLDTFLSDDKMHKNQELLSKCKNIIKIQKGNSARNNKDDTYNSFSLPENMTIGIEIEAEGESAKLLKNIKTSDDEWKIKIDGSLKNGIEVISPVLYNEEKNVKRLYEITEAMQDMGLSTSERCGAHVHIGADYIESVDELKELLEIYGNAEKIYYYISNQPEELPRKGIDKYAKTISKDIENSDLANSNEDEFIEDAQAVQNTRYKSMNLMNVNFNNAKNTIEFRASNGTLNPNVWIENIRLYGRTVQTAHEIGQIKEKVQQGKTITEQEKGKLQLKENLKRDISDNKKMETLMCLLFDEEERKVYNERYKKNKELDSEKHIVDSLIFGRVDFEKIYNSVEIPQHIIQDLQEENTKEQDESKTEEMR